MFRYNSPKIIFTKFKPVIHVGCGNSPIEYQPLSGAKWNIRPSLKFRNSLWFMGRNFYFRSIFRKNIGIFTIFWCVILVRFRILPIENQHHASSRSWMVPVWNFETHYGLEDTIFIYGVTFEKIVEYLRNLVHMVGMGYRAHLLKIRIVALTERVRIILKIQNRF